MKRSLLELLRSPYDGSPLTLEDPVEKDGEVHGGRLVDGARTVFPIVEGVPLLAPEAAEGESFGFKWSRIGDSYGHEEPSRTTRRRWYLDRFGYDGEEGLRSELARRPLVLDAGCGSGVDTALFAESGSTVVAVDLSREAAQATYRRLGRLPNVHVLQADLRVLPFAHGLFDYVSSDQVLHHTPDTASTFAAVRRHLKPGGRIAIYVYSRKSPLREFADDFLREHTTRMSVEECWEFSRTITLLGKALSDLHAEVDVPEGVPLLGIRAGRHDVQRLVYWNIVKCFWRDEYDFELNVAVNFDWYHPRYAFRHTPEEVAGWLARNDLEEVRLIEVESGVAAVADAR